MVRNTYRVAKSQWAKWNEKTRALFNNTYADIQRVGPSLFLHPTTIKRKLTPAEFKTISWNAAWCAAEQHRRPGDVAQIVEV